MSPPSVSAPDRMDCVVDDNGRMAYVPYLREGMVAAWVRDELAALERLHSRTADPRAEGAMDVLRLLLEYLESRK